MNVVCGHAAGPAQRPGGRLDLESNNSAPTRTLVIPVNGGRLDPLRGQRQRGRDIVRIKAAVAGMKHPAMLTLTPDRKRFSGPAEAHRVCERYLCQLLRKMGLKTWLRVTEVQSKSGDGWLHYHIIVDMEDPSRLQELRSVAWRWWGHAGTRVGKHWRLGGVDLDPLQSAHQAVAYVVKYVTKPWPAFPQWVLRLKRLRTIGFSKTAGQMVRAALNLPEPNPQQSQDSKGQKRRSRTILDRLSGSGLSYRVMKATAILGGWKWELLGIVKGILFDDLHQNRDRLGLSRTGPSSEALEWNARGNPVEALRQYAARYETRTKAWNWSQARRTELWESWDKRHCPTLDPSV